MSCQYDLFPIIFKLQFFDDNNPFTDPYINKPVRPASFENSKEGNNTQ